MSKVYQKIKNFVNEKLLFEFDESGLINHKDPEIRKYAEDAVRCRDMAEFHAKRGEHKESGIHLENYKNHLKTAVSLSQQKGENPEKAKGPHTTTGANIW